jgi:hypothetical protein
VAVVSIIEPTLPDPDLLIFINNMAYIYSPHAFSVLNSIPDETDKFEVILIHLFVPHHDFQLLIQVFLLHID